MYIIQAQAIAADAAAFPQRASSLSNDLLAHAQATKSTNQQRFGARMNLQQSLAAKGNKRGGAAAAKLAREGSGGKKQQEDDDKRRRWTAARAEQAAAAGTGSRSTIPADALSPEQRRVCDAVTSGRNVFFTGSAGTGKSVCAS